MELITEFVIKGTPSTVTAQQKGETIYGHKIHHFKKKNVREAEAILKDQLLPYLPDEPYECPLCIRAMWLFDKKSLTKKEMKSFKMTRPDLDNMFKGLADVMGDMGFFVDDNQIVNLELTKAWSREFPGMFIQIWKLEDGDYERLVDDWRNVEW